MTRAHAPHILVVDDDAKVRLLLRRCFEGEGYVVSEAADGAEVERALVKGAFEWDLVTLDLTLPDTDGLTLAGLIRAKSQVPIVMVSGKGETIDRVVGLEVGADDYITKPFHTREVIARVRAVLRRSESRDARADPGKQADPAGAEERYVFEGWTLELERRELKNEANDVVDLTTAEFELLLVFVRNAGRVLSRDQIMDQLRGHAWTPLDRSIDNMVAKLRKKIEANPERPVLLKTVRGVGYTFAARVKRFRDHPG